jgi:23S rRNA pseudouridine1911/1915/1917 synthase
MAVLEPGPGQTARQAVTELFVREPLGPFTVLECVLQTGRTHQIRVHCQFAGFPVVGDSVYGGLRKVGSDGGARSSVELNALVAALHGQTLHAYHLSFDHPRTRERLTFEASPPAEMTDLIERARALTGAATS